MRENLKKDRARSRIGPISTFGLLEMTRQRMRASLRKSLHTECSHCSGLGYTMSSESVVLTVMRRLALVMQRQDVARVELTISPDVAFQLLNRKRMELTRLETQHKKPVLVRVGGRTIDHILIAAFDSRNAPLNTDPATTLKQLRKAGDKTFRDVDDPELPETADPVFAEEDPILDTSHDEPDEDVRRDKDGLVDVRAEVDAQNKKRDNVDGGDDVSEEGGKKKRRRRRRGGRKRKKSGDGETEAGGGAETGSSDPGESNAGTDEAKDEADASPDVSDASDGPDGEGGKKKRRRRRRGGRKRKKSADEGAVEAKADDGDGDGAEASQDAPSEENTAKQEAEAERKADEPTGDEPQAAGDAPVKKKTKRTRRRSKSAAKKDEAQAGDGDADGNKAQPSADPQPDVDGNTASTANKPSKKKRVRKRNAPPPPGEGTGYTNKIVNVGPSRD
jgi:ribonuclease E